MRLKTPNKLNPILAWNASEMLNRLLFLEVLTGLMIPIYMRSRKSGNIGYIVDYQALKWQHLWQQGSNKRQHFNVGVVLGDSIP
jgi:hypothetical protein